MEAIEQNDDEMILVVVGDEGPELEEINSTDDTAEHEYLIEVKPEIETLDEEFLSEDINIKQEFIQDDLDKKIETKVLPKKRVPRKTNHKYLSDEEDAKNNKKRNNNKSPKNKKKKTKLKPPPKLTPKPKQAKKSAKNIESEVIHSTIKNEEGYLEIEFLDDDVLVSSKPAVEDINETEVIDDLQKKNKRNTNTPSKEPTVKEEVDDEYIPKEEDEMDEEYIEDEYIPPRGRRRKSKAPGHTKAVERPIRSFIAELKKKQPIFKEDKDKLVDYLVEYMRKRTPPSPPPDYYYLNDDDMYCCSYCGMEKPTEAAAGRHYQAAHGPRYLVCLACGSGYRSTVILYKHEKRCTGPEADIQLVARSVYLGRKARGRPFITNNKFIPKEPPPDRPPKRIHIPHCLKTKYYCSQCPAYFTREYLLDEHMHKHTGYRAFQCPDCPAAYVSRYQLNKHSKKHSDMQYVCDHCGKVFKLKTTLSTHMDTHLPRPRFGCGRCGRRYAKRAAVRVHIMRDHMNMPPPAACPVCPKRYNRMSHVKLHMKRDHKLTMLTKRSIERELPYMKIEDLAGAKVVFDKEDGVEVMDIIPTVNEQILP